MYCHRHPSLPNVGECSDCHRGLCAACANRFRPPLCVDDLESRVLREVGPIKRRPWVALVLAVGGVFLGDFILSLTAPGQRPELLERYLHYRAVQHAWLVPFLLGLFLGAAPYGWSVTKNVRYPSGVFVPFSWYWHLWLYKYFGAIFLGPVLLPFALVRDFRRYRQLERIFAVAVRAETAPAEPQGAPQYAQAPVASGRPQPGPPRTVDARPIKRVVPTARVVGTTSSNMGGIDMRRAKGQAPRPLPVQLGELE